MNSKQPNKMMLQRNVRNVRTKQSDLILFLIILGLTITCSTLQNKKNMGPAFSSV